MALVSKILESTLTAGSTSVTFTDSDIPNSLIRVFSSNSDVIPESRILSGNTLTVTYAPQNSNMDVALEIVKQGLDIIDNVLSEDTDKALSAKQGYLLSAAIGDVNDRLDALVIPEDITDLEDVNVTSIQDGQVLAWDEDTSKFVNVTPAQSDGIHYTANEEKIGTFLNVDLFRKTIDLGSDVSVSYNSWTTLSSVISDIYLIINCWGTNVGGTFTPLQATYNASKQIQIQTPRNNYNQNVRFLTIEYTKVGIS